MPSAAPPVAMPLVDEVVPAIAGFPAPSITIEFARSEEEPPMYVPHTRVPCGVNFTRKASVCPACVIWWEKSVAMPLVLQESPVR